VQNNQTNSHVRKSISYPSSCGSCPLGDHQCVFCVESAQVTARVTAQQAGTGVLVALSSLAVGDVNPGGPFSYLDRCWGGQ